MSIMNALSLHKISICKNCKFTNICSKKINELFACYTSEEIQNHIELDDEYYEHCDNVCDICEEQNCPYDKYEW